MTVEEAQSALAEAGFEWTVEDKVSTTEAPGTVLSQEPAGGERVEPGAQIILTVAKLPPVPSVVGLKLGGAKDQLSEAGFRWKVEREVSLTEAAGTVIRQSPSPGTGAQAGTRVTLTVAKLPTVPNVVGQNLGKAKDILSDAGFKWTVRRVVSSEPAGMVLSQDPKAGAKAKGGARIVLTVAKKAPQPCHPSYEGACLLPYASDYDCAGGSGNGPYYTGFVYVVGPDVFGLDADGDGLGCE